MTITPEQYEAMQVAAALGNPTSPVPGEEADAVYATLLAEAQALIARGVTVEIPPF
jgi:hypothetical protein